ncbi:MAG: hypothetical protein WCP74_05690 [Sphingobacteriia bacterium]|jgi:hypothetical protein
MDNIDQIEQLSENVQSLINAKVELFKLQTLEIMANAFSVLLKRLLLCLIFLVFLAFFSLGLAIYLSNRMDNPFLGYFTVGLLYLLIFVMVLLDQHGFIESIILNKTLGFFFNSNTK